MSQAPLQESPIRRVAVVGPGRMGNFIALAYAFAGLETFLVDLRERSADESRRRRTSSFAAIESAIEFLINHDAGPAEAREQTLNRINWTDESGADAVFAKADLIIEAIAEQSVQKSPILQRIARQASVDCVIGSTTSTIAPDELASMVTRPERYLNIHWLNPAHLSPLVELQPCSQTDAKLVDSLKGLHETMGKIPIVCGPTPGYLMPRLQIALMNEAVRMVEEGVASAVDIDRAVRFGLGLRYANMGVLEFVDWGGVEILLNAGRYMAKATGEQRFEPPAIVSQMIKEGRGGLRDGQGFHDWRNQDVQTRQRSVQHRIFELLRDTGQIPRYEALSTKGR